MRRILFTITIISLALLLIINGRSAPLGKELDRKELSERKIKETINKITDIVLFSGYQGEYGRMVNIKHSSGFQTYYGHLSSIAGDIRPGKKVFQGDIIGYVGPTGLATGPHLDYKIKINDRFVNPLTVALPQGELIPKAMQAKFKQTIDNLNIKLASANNPFIASSEKERRSS